MSFLLFCSDPSQTSIQTAPHLKPLRPEAWLMATSGLLSCDTFWCDSSFRHAAQRRSRSGWRCGPRRSREPARPSEQRLSGTAKWHARLPSPRGVGVTPSPRHAPAPWAAQRGTPCEGRG